MKCSWYACHPRLDLVLVEDLAHTRIQQQDGWRLLSESLQARGTSPAELQHFKQQAWQFYLSQRTAGEHETAPSSQNTSLLTPSVGEVDPQTLSFQDIAKLILDGKEPPNIRHFDDTLISAQPASQPTLATQPGAGKKPWET